MSVKGIDEENCSRCGQCIIECGRGYFSKSEDGKIIFNENLITCNLCGHCIAVCKDEAIITENLQETTVVENPTELVPYENLLSLMKNKRSIRRYKKQKIPKEILEKVFAAIRAAPSASNSRSWMFTVLTEEEKIKAISDATISAMYQYMGFPSAEKAIKFFESQKRDPIFYNAPAVIFVSNQKGMGMPATDTAIAITYGQLAAETLGLGTCWIGMVQGAIPANKKILEIAGVTGRVNGVMIIGYPAIKYHKTAPRRPLDIKGL
jgi:nitroreductase/NAD-dependent dihydropyrimidine dehydrogenase PreA subunit